MRVALAVLTTIASTTAQMTVFTDATRQHLIDQIQYYCGNPDPYAPIGTWDVSALTNGAGLFRARGYNCAATDLHDINLWNTSSITILDDAFRESGPDFASVDLSNWNVEAVTSLNRAFAGSQFFNGVIETWTLSSLTQMYYTFGANTAFNRDISGWNVAKVTKMSATFYGATAFNQDLNAWGPRLRANPKTCSMARRRLTKPSRGGPTFTLGHWRPTGIG